MPSTAKLISRVHLRRGVATRWGGEEGERKNNTRPHWIHAAPRATRLVRLASQSRLSLPGNIAAMHTHTHTHTHAWPHNVCYPFVTVEATRSFSPRNNIFDDDNYPFFKSGDNIRFFHLNNNQNFENFSP